VCVCVCVCVCRLSETEGNDESYYAYLTRRFWRSKIFLYTDSEKEERNSSDDDAQNRLQLLAIGAKEGELCDPNATSSVIRKATENIEWGPATSSSPDAKEDESRKMQGCDDYWLHRRLNSHSSHLTTVSDSSRSATGHHPHPQDRLRNWKGEGKIVEIPQLIRRLTLQRRFTCMEAARGVDCVGILLVDTQMSISSPGLVQLLKVLRARGIKYYIFALSRCTPSMIGNFLSIEAFVLVGCPLRTAWLISRREFHAPFLSPYEMLIALSSRPGSQDDDSDGACGDDTRMSNETNATPEAAADNEWLVRRDKCWNLDDDVDSWGRFTHACAL